MSIENEIADLYPSTYIKETNRQIYFNANQIKLHNLWPGVELDARKTFDTYHKGLSKINRYDTQSTAEMAFRIKNGSQRLPTLDIVSKWKGYNPDSTCRRCGLIEETDAHILQCSHSFDALYVAIRQKN